MNEREMIRRQIPMVLNEIQFLTRLLYSVSDEQSRHLALQELWQQTSFLRFLLDLAESESRSESAAPGAAWPKQMPAVAGRAPSGELPPGMMPAPGGELPPVTRSQLAAATGRNGNPAWIAANGVVYDVTNNAAWSTATHFGLSAGRDLTAEFSSCHAEQPGILNTLMPVGRLT